MNTEEQKLIVDDESDNSSCEAGVDTEDMEEDIKCQVIPRGKPKSGRTWKDPRPISLSKISKPKTLRTDWQKKVEEKLIKKSIKKLENDLFEGKRKKLQDLKMRQKQNKERRLINERKSEVVQKITNLKKLKNTKKKHLRKIETR